MGLDHRRDSPARARNARHSAERAEHVFLARNLRLLRIEDLTRPAIGRPQPRTAIGLPRLAIDPSMTAALLLRSQTSSATAGVSRASRQAHHRDHAANALIGKHEERRLL